MPEHIHLLIGEPDERSVALTMQVLKQRVSRQCLARGRSRLPQKDAPPPFWLPLSYDFNVFSEKKVAEKLEYIHWNPVKRGLLRHRNSGDGAVTGITLWEKKDQSGSAVNDTHPLRPQSASSSHVGFKDAKD